MRRDFITTHSNALNEDMNVIVYGEGGYPVVVFQVQDAKCNNFEDFGMIDLLSDYIDGGVLQLFSIDGIDEESWSDRWGDKAYRAQRQEDYFRYVTDELIPLVHEINGTNRRPLAIGCSMGATRRSGRSRSSTRSLRRIRRQRRRRRSSHGRRASSARATRRPGPSSAPTRRRSRSSPPSRG